jgi:hypothetical protein
MSAKPPSWAEAPPATCTASISMMQNHDYALPRHFA